ncbi:MAG: DUF2309 domain-containing protein [Planctomycetaceae bacterium]
MTPTDDTRAELALLLTDAARFLPPQGPIDAFVAQNTLQGFEDLPFEEAVVRAARLYDAEPFLSESRYREALASGRIRTSDIEAVLDADLGDRGAAPLAGGRTTLARLHRALLLHPVRLESDTAVRWTLTESDAIERLRPDLDEPTRGRFVALGRAAGGASDAAAERIVAADLWHACIETMALVRPAVVHVQPPVRHRDLLVAIDPTLDTDALVHPLLIRLTAADLDQGVAAWPMPGRDRGLLAAVAELVGHGGGPLEAWARPLPGRLRRIAAASGTVLPPESFALDVIAAELEALGIPCRNWPDHVARTIVALRGWAAMVRQFEVRPDRTPVVRLPARLADFLALRLVLDRAAAEWTLRTGGFPLASGNGTAPGLGAAWVELRDRFPPRRGPGSLARALLLHQVAQLVGLTAADVRNFDENDLLGLERAIAAFDAIARRRLFHLAYERRHAIEVLDALAAHAPGTAPSPPGRPRVQAVLCIDDRCESFRRYLEEADPRITTFGAAGFFSVPMYYRGLDDWHTTPLCPIVMRPGHTVTEVAAEETAALHRRRQSLRRLLARFRGGAENTSRTLVRGGLLTSIGGALAAVPLVARVVFPRLTSLATSRAADMARSRIRTRLELHRVTDTPLADGTLAGFNVAEMAAIVRRLLEDVGLTAGFAPLVAVVGHGSTSLNNPHESAYDCGACGGGRGGPNARAFALMANDPAVRTRLAAEGLVIPADTLFVGGMLDTCTSRVRWEEVDRVPATHAAAFVAFRDACGRAGALDARERCRRFDSVPLDVSPEEALRRVEGRAGDLAQVRPEYGHASTAVCVVGPRSLTRGLYLDRRAFLVSYDSSADSDGRILERTLAAVGPVCGGINLAYLFSRVDPVGYGAGTKLPHNITGLIGVMDGHASDLRTGLPLQGVEIHEPVRLLLVIDAPTQRIRDVLDRLPAVKRLVENQWVRTVARDPETATLAVHTTAADGSFVPYAPESSVLPTAADSTAWFRGRRDNVPPARILAGLVERRGAVSLESAR